MEWNNKVLFLLEDEVNRLSRYLVYGSGLGILLGMFTENVMLYFSLGGVSSIVISLIVCFIKRIKKQDI